MMRLLVGLLAAIVLIASPARSEEWPSGTNRVIVPFAAGGPVDFPTRLLIERLVAQTKGVFILENRAGAGGSVGLEAVVQAKPDGQTFLLTTSSIAMAPTMYPRLAFEPTRDLTPISLVTEVPIVIATLADNPIKNLEDLIARARAAPGKITFGSGGVGTGNHLAGELLKKMAKVDLLHVPYRGTSQSMAGLYAKDIDIIFVSGVDVMPHVKDGKVRVLAVGTPKRIAAYDGVPAIAEQFPGYVMTNWYGFFAPKDLPKPILDRLVKEIEIARNDPALKEKAATAGMEMQLTGPDRLRERLDLEVPRWRQLIPEIGIKIE